MKKIFVCGGQNKFPFYIEPRPSTLRSNLPDQLRVSLQPRNPNYKISFSKPGSRRKSSRNFNTNAPLMTLYDTGFVVISLLMVMAC